MIILDEVKWTTPGVKADRVSKNILGQSLCLVINSVVVEILPIDLSVSEMLISSTNILECIEVDGYFCLNINYPGGSETVLCDEKTQAILLSDPEFAPILESHKYKEFVTIGWSYINGEFIIPGEME
jgi:hypothetical protein